jgi:hypothetical protein
MIALSVKARFAIKMLIVKPMPPKKDTPRR